MSEGENRVKISDINHVPDPKVLEGFKEMTDKSIEQFSHARMMSSVVDSEDSDSQTRSEENQQKMEDEAGQDSLGVEKSGLSDHDKAINAFSAAGIGELPETRTTASEETEPANSRELAIRDAISRIGSGEDVSVIKEELKEAGYIDITDIGGLLVKPGDDIGLEFMKATVNSKKSETSNINSPDNVAQEEVGSAEEIRGEQVQVQEDPNKEVNLAEIRATNEARESIRSNEVSEEVLDQQVLGDFEQERRDQNYERAIAEIQEEAEHTEELLTFEERAEERLAQSELGRALGERIKELETIDPPQKINIIRKIYLKVAKTEKYNELYLFPKKAYAEAQDELKKLNKTEREWVKRESRYLSKADRDGAEISELYTKLKSEGLNKKENRRLHKLANGLVTERMSIDEFFLADLSEKFGKSVAIDEGNVDIPKAESHQSILEKEKEVKREVLESLKSNPEIAAIIRDIGPDYAELFWNEQAGETIRDYSIIKTELTEVESRLDSIIEGSLFVSNPLELQKLLLQASEKKLLADQSFFAVKGALKGYASKKFWKDWGEDFVSGAKNILARTLEAREVNSDIVGERFEREIDHETELMDIINGGQNSLAEGIRRIIWTGKRIDQISSYGDKAISESRRALNETLGKIIPEREKYQDKVFELRKRLAEVDERLDDLSYFFANQGETREQAEERLRKDLNELDFDEATRRSFTLNIINELTLENPRTKGALIREYELNGFTADFADLLYSAIEQSKLVAKRRQLDLSARIEDIELRIEHIERSEELAIEQAAEEFDFSEEAYLQELRESLERARTEYQEYEEKIARSVKDQIGALNGKVEASAIKSLETILRK